MWIPKGAYLRSVASWRKYGMYKTMIRSSKFVAFYVQTYASFGIRSDELPSLQPKLRFF